MPKYYLVVSGKSEVRSPQFKSLRLLSVTATLCNCKVSMRLKDGLLNSCLYLGIRLISILSFCTNQRKTSLGANPGCLSLTHPK